ncbi:MAG TPA: hypothetical protein VHX65_07625 [Pirellulales bacterium]|nr:hypothetical protein [Pirellulales bacterium]
MFGKRANVVITAAVAALLIGVASWLMPASRSAAQDPALPPQPLPDAGAPQQIDTPGQEVLTNGPVHEAYAEPTALNPQPPMIVPKQPPAAVQEMPPDVKPDGQNVVWIPGYWAWDDGRQDFIWVSGIWRDTPPNHAWIAGYWTGTTGGYQWTPGIWAPSNVEQVNYVPQPPNSLETGPNTPAPTANDFWVPGTYEYVEGNWAWRPGYWTAAQPDWIWIPAHYVWTPSGYLFIHGHWDYELSHRGVLFAPVAFNFGWWGPRPIYYGPAVVIDPGVLTADFFVRPGYYHYYFGDCYGPAYVGWGFHPWFAVGIGYDPLFTYYRWYNVRRDPGWAIRVNERFVYMGAHPGARPPRTYAMSIRVGAPGGVRIGVTINDFARRAGPTHFQTVSMSQRQEYAREGVRSNRVAQERAMAETHPGGRPGAPRSLDMHALAQSNGGHLPGAAPGRTGAMAERGPENRGVTNTGRSGVTNSAVRPGTTPTTGRPGFPPGVPSRTPSNTKKPPEDKGGGRDSGGRYLIQPNGNAASLASQVPAEPRPDQSQADQSQADLSQPSAPGADLGQQAMPDFGTFGGLVVPSRIGSGAAPSNSAFGADDNAALQATGGKDPIKPLILSPQLSPQLSQIGASGRGQFGAGLSANSYLPFTSPSSLLHEVGDPALRDSATDPIHPLTLIPPISLPLGNSQFGLPSAPSNRSGSVSQEKDPVRPLRIAPPNGS